MMIPFLLRQYSRVDKLPRQRRYRLCFLFSTVFYVILQIRSIRYYYRENKNELHSTEATSSTRTGTTSATTSNATEQRLFDESRLDPNEPIPISYKKEPIPTNLHFAFLGDSLSRYQYLSLAAFLRTGQWPATPDRPNMCMEGKAGGHEKFWADFYNFTKTALSPYEECDCWRVKAEKKTHFENRFYWDKSHNNTLSVFMKSGMRAVDIHWHASDVHKPHELVNERPEPLWRAKTEVEIIDSYLPYLTPRPEYVIMNQGSWQFHTLSEENLPDIVAALKRHGFIGVYRMNGAGVRKNTAHDDAYCKAFDICLDSEWTKRFANSKHLWDGVHWHAHMNRLFNLQLLDAIRDHRGFL